MILLTEYFYYINYLEIILIKSETNFIYIFSEIVSKVGICINKHNFLQFLNSD